MIDVIVARAELLKARGRGEIGGDETHVRPREQRREILVAAAAREVVHERQLVAVALAEFRGEVTADESRGSGDENFRHE